MLPGQIEGQQPGLSFLKIMGTGAHPARGPRGHVVRVTAFECARLLWPSRPVPKGYILRK